jgi:hypothetical protein
VNHPVVGELHLHRDKLPVDDMLLVLYYADQGSESDEKLRLLASIAQTPGSPLPPGDHAGAPEVTFGPGGRNGSPLSGL